MGRTSKYSNELKSQIVLEYEAGKDSLEGFGKKYNISYSNAKRWRYISKSVFKRFTACSH